MPAWNTGGGSSSASGTAPLLNTYANIIATTPAAGTQGLTTDGGGALVYLTTPTARWAPLLVSPLSTVIGRAPPAAAGWTHINQGTSTLTDDKGRLIYTTQPSATVSYRSIVRTRQGLVASAYVQCRAWTPSMVQNAASQFPGVGLVMRESGTLKCARMMMLHDSTTAGTTNTFITCSYGTDTAVTVSFGYTPQSPDVFMQIAISGGNVLYQVSNDPNQGWTTISQATVATTTAFGTAPDQVGIVSDTFADPNTTKHIIAHWEQGDAGGATVTQ